MNTRRALVVLLVGALLATLVPAPGGATGAQPTRARQGMVVSQNFMASQVGVEVLWAGGTAVDAAVATAFALAVTHPAAGNIGGGGFLLYRPFVKQAFAGGICAGYVGVTPGGKQVIHGPSKDTRGIRVSKRIFPFWSV